MADDTGYAPSPLGGVTPSSGAALPIVAPPKTTGAYSPSDIHAALINAGAPPAVAPTLTAITGAESNFGKSVVSPPNHNGSRDYGVFQVNDAAHPQYGGAAVAHLPLQQQANIAVQIYNKEGLKAWSTYNNGAYKGYLNKVGSTTPTGAITPAPDPTTTAPPAGNVGAAIAALNMPTGQSGARSTMDNLSSMAGGGGGGGGESPPPMNLEGQQSAAAGGNARQQMLAMQGAQMAAALRAKQGLQGVPGPSSQPSFMGGQMIPMPTAAPTPGAPPGTTLNSTGGLYG